MGNTTREWGWRDVVWLTTMLVVGLVIVLAIALAVPGFTGATVLWILGVLVVVLMNLGLGVLAVGSYIEVVHQDWNDLGGFDHLVMLASLLGVAAADVAIAWQLFGTHSGLSWGFVGLAALATVVGMAMARSLWPHHRRAPRQHWLDSFSFLSMLLGMIAGAALSVVLLVGSAWYHTSFTQTSGPVVPEVRGVAGSYVALGDSYSAGEGLQPWATTVDNKPSPFGADCHRSALSAYPELLEDGRGQALLGRPGSWDAACSGAIIADVFTARPGSSVTAPQVPPGVFPDVGLVTLTIGGNDLLFSRVVLDCLKTPNCLSATFPERGDPKGWFADVAPGPLLTHWVPATEWQVAQSDGVLFDKLRSAFPKARIVAIGYPYLFPDGPARLPLDCVSILRRVSEPVRHQFRGLEDDLNNLTYEEAVAHGVEFVSPTALWDGHEPCGARPEYVNSVKPYLSLHTTLSDVVDGGTFHPTVAGQRALATVVACYLDEHPTPPDAFAGGAGGGGMLTVPDTWPPNPTGLGLVPSPGSLANPLRSCP